MVKVILGIKQGEAKSKHRSLPMGLKANGLSKTKKKIAGSNKEL